VGSTVPPFRLSPATVNGEMISAGVRGPKPMWSTCGGAIGSKNPPKSSHTTTMTVERQNLLFMMLLTRFTVQFSPAHTLFPRPGCSLYDSGGMTHDTAGRWPCRTSGAKSAGGRTWRHIPPNRT
jgi:hypothetical protein